MQNDDGAKVRWKSKLFFKVLSVKITRYKKKQYKDISQKWHVSYRGGTFLTDA